MNPNTTVAVAQEFIESYDQQQAALRAVVDAWSFISEGDQPYQMREALKRARAALANARSFAVMRGGR